MKTKIIYISGNEVFEMSQIRAAFDEVRAALGLDNDTILFGVPVDSDCALDIPSADTTSPAKTVVSDVAPVVVDDEPVELTAKITPVVEDVVPVTEITEPELSPENIVIESEAEPIVDTTPSPEIDPVSEPVAVDVEPVAVDVESVAEAVIPILSILAPQSSDSEPVATPDANLESPVSDIVVDTTVDAMDVPVEEVVAEPTPMVEAAETVVISDINIDATLSAPAMADDDVAEKITIGDMIGDEAPVAPVTHSLETLLESMAPLREDVISDEGSDAMSGDMPVFEADADDDSTLVRLASEFAESADKIIATPKSEPTGKIGKLKNILPFKKAKRDDSSLMGDLFGWAGIAANDEDFTIPGFFANAKKQGA